MSVKALALSLLLAMMAVVPAAAQRGGPPVGAWELLGEHKVGFKADQDVVNINQNEEWFRNRAFRRLRLDVSRADLHLLNIRLVYLNGYSEDLRVDRKINEGESLPVDLPGERSYLKAVVLTHRSQLGLSIGRGGIKIEQALVRVYGERVRRGPPPVAAAPPLPPRGWTEMDRAVFDRRLGEVVFSRLRDDGRVGRIRLRAVGENVIVRAVQIRFRNGQTQSVRLNRRLEAGQMSDVIDLDGQTRRLAEVVVLLDPRRRAGRAELELLGSARPGSVATAWQRLATGTFRAGQRDVEMQVGARAGRFSQIRLRAPEESVRVRDVRIRFANGDVQTVNIDDRIRGDSRVIDLNGGGRFISAVIVELSRRGNRDGGLLELAGLAVEAPSGRPAPVVGPDWQLLGQQSVGFRVDRDAIDIAHADDWYRNRAFQALQFFAEGNDVHLINVQVVYINGYSEDYRVDRLLPAGAAVPLDLRGERSFLRRIELTYRARPGFGGRATVKVYGVPARRRGR